MIRQSQEGMIRVIYGLKRNCRKCVVNRTRHKLQILYSKPQINNRGKYRYITTAKLESGQNILIQSPLIGWCLRCKIIPAEQRKINID